MRGSIEKSLAVVLIALFVATVLTVIWQVIGRYVLAAPSSGTEELARFLLIWITFLGATLAYQQGRHIAVTLLRDSLPERLRRIVSGAGMLVAIAFLVTLAVIGWRYMGMQSFQKSPSLRMSMGIVYAVMPVCAAIMAGLSVIDLLRLLAGQEPRGLAAVPEGLE